MNSLQLSFLILRFLDGFRTRDQTLDFAEAERTAVRQTRLADSAIWTLRKRRMLQSALSGGSKFGPMVFSQADVRTLWTWKI
ncbi:unnamed protein product [Sphagnum jensenii]|uniref:Uncharacterized protein n=1 Tax=Sphagnum jensenii TaxID=128206 RepID=A0ABP1BW28_9BRYO